MPKMTAKDWGLIKHFTSTEFKHPLEMDKDFMLKIDSFRQWLGYKIHVHADARPDGKGHSKNSYHYFGQALDFHCRDEKDNIINPWKILMAALVWGWSGIGVYPHWLHPGMHLDARYPAKYFANSIWIRENGVYKSLKPMDIIKHIKEDIKWTK